MEQKKSIFYFEILIWASTAIVNRTQPTPARLSEHDLRKLRYDWKVNFSKIKKHSQIKSTVLLIVLVTYFHVKHFDSHNIRWFSIYTKKFTIKTHQFWKCPIYIVQILMRQFCRQCPYLVECLSSYLITWMRFWSLKIVIGVQVGSDPPGSSQITTMRWIKTNKLHTPYKKKHSFLHAMLWDN